MIPSDFDWPINMLVGMAVGVGTGVITVYKFGSVGALVLLAILFIFIIFFMWLGHKDRVFSRSRDDRRV